MAGGASRSLTASPDASGRFLIQGIEPGNYRLYASRNTFVSTEYPQGGTITLTAKQRMSEVLLKMTPHGVVAGRVIDEDGEPVVHAQVQVTPGACP